MTRLADLGPLDRARPHVYGAITPLARDLTTHLGKGATPAAARVSAMMEAIERASAELPAEPCLTMSYEMMINAGRQAIDPAQFTLPPGSAYAPDRRLRWSPARRMADGAQVFLAADLVLSPPEDGIILQPDTNGLASGNTLAEAILHGLCEVVERDAMGRDLFARLYGDPGDVPLARQIDPQTLPNGAASIVDRVQAAGMDFAIFDHTGDIGIPVISAYLCDPRFPGPVGPEERRFFGYGCAPRPAKALQRALTEAEQSRVCVLQGARDSFNMVPKAGTPDFTGQDTVPFDQIAAAPDVEDLRDDLVFVLHALAERGMRDVFVADLTHPRLGQPVVRVRVPGLSVFLVDRSRVGTRDLAQLT